jgi:hypothetical protein
LPASSAETTPATFRLSASGLDLRSARIVWEAEGQEPAYGASFALLPNKHESRWIEAEAQMPDGRRVFGVAELQGGRVK